MTTAASEILKYGVLFGWADDEKGKPLKVKLAEAAESHKLRLGTTPNLALVNEAEAEPVEGWEIKASPLVRPNCYFLTTSPTMPDNVIGVYGGVPGPVAALRLTEPTTEAARKKHKPRKPAPARHR